MSVSETTALPNQPASGSTEYQGLGGDGLIAPHSVTAIQMNVAADGSGGTLTTRVDFDPRYCSVVSFIVGKVTAATADVIMQFSIAQSAIDRFILVDTGIFLAATSETTGTLVPPPMLILQASSTFIPRIEFVVPNVNTEVAQIGLRVYNFRREVQTQIPLPFPFAVLTR